MLPCLQVPRPGQHVDAVRGEAGDGRAGAAEHRVLGGAGRGAQLLHHRKVKNVKNNL